MRLLRAADHRRMPWKNGGGETLEIAVFPEGAGIDAFGWRVSVAVVAVDGPFSVFPGVDRTLVLLDGDGMILDIAGRGPVTLAPEGVPCAFPADAATRAILIGGAITDLNVMTARGRYSHAVERFAAPRALRAGPPDAPLLLLGDGMIVEKSAGCDVLGARDVFLLEPGDTARATPAGDATGLLVTIRALG